MTPQDIREKVIEKALIGGYDIAAVDQLREEVAVALAAKDKEIAVLKGKMKVVVDKIEDYRATEDAMRLALREAQKVGQQITADAEAKAKKTIADADAYAQRVIGGLQQAKADEEERLLLAKAASAKFMQDARALCLNQLNYLDTLSTASKVEPKDVPEVKPVEADPVQEIIAEVAAEPVPEIAEPAAPAAETAPAAEEPVDEATQLYRFLQNNV